MHQLGSGKMEVKEPQEFNLTEEQKKMLLNLARETLDSAFKGLPMPKLDVNLPVRPFGVFVTLKKGKKLRGCIGTFKSQEVEKMVIEATLSSAFQDPRFPPVTSDELPELNYEITLLTPLTPVKNLDEIVVGQDGLLVEKGFQRGLLLPQVAVEQSWDKYTFLMYTCVKAGLPPDCYKDPEVRIFKFQGLVISEEHNNEGP